MLPEMESFVPNREKKGKFCRWAGFIGGCIFSAENVAELDILKLSANWPNMERAFIYLGMVQGCLWYAGVYTLEDLKSHNRS
jgi:hypothetical protein